MHTRSYTPYIHVYTYVFVQYICIDMYRCEHVHQHDSRARVATSPALEFASICQFPVSNKMDGPRIETQPRTFACFYRERKGDREREIDKWKEREREKERREGRPTILFATTLIPREPPPPRYSALRSRIIPFRVFCALKYKYVGERSHTTSFFRFSI